MLVYNFRWVNVGVNYGIEYRFYEGGNGIKWESLSFFKVVEYVCNRFFCVDECSWGVVFS